MLKLILFGQNYPNPKPLNPSPYIQSFILDKNVNIFNLCKKVTVFKFCSF